MLPLPGSDAVASGPVAPRRLLVILSVQVVYPEYLQKVYEEQVGKQKAVLYDMLKSLCEGSLYEFIGAIPE